MPSHRNLAAKETHGVSAIPLSSLSYADALPPSDAWLCKRAVHAIWRSLDEHDLLEEKPRVDLASILEPLIELEFGDRPRRLIDVLRLPNPLDPAHLYWLTRRLLTLVPELQAVANASRQPAGNRSTPLS